MHKLAFGYFRDVQRMVRDDRWKLVWYPKIQKTQLFDLQNDPFERHNLAETLIHRARRDNLRERLRAWFTSQGDSVFVKK